MKRSLSFLLHQYKLVTTALAALSSLSASTLTQTEEEVFVRSSFTRKKTTDVNHDNEDSTTTTSFMTTRDLSPLLPIRIFNPNPNLEIAFDVRTRNPVYVMERLVFDPPNSSGSSSRAEEEPSPPHNLNRGGGGAHKQHHNFYEEKSLPVAFRSRNGAYHLSGYDRGHMAPAADFDNNNPEQQRMQTYNLTNISPQDHQINHRVWARLEVWCRKVAYKYNKYKAHDGEEDEGHQSASGKHSGRTTATSTYVVTGPIWLPSRQVREKAFEYNYSGIGRPPSLVSVPTHFFKVVAVVLHEKGKDGDCHSSITHYACFVIPNNADARDWTLEDAMVRWTDLEAVTGLEFFPSLVDETWKRQADAVVSRTMKTISSSSSSQQLPLLLPPSTSSSTTTSSSLTTTTNVSGLCRTHKTKRHGKVNHICSNGTCQLYKTI